MFNKILCAAFSLVSMLLVFDSFSQTKATIIIKKNQNGTVTEETRSVTLAEGQDIQSVLLEMGALDENGNLKEGQQFEIKIDKSSIGGSYHTTPDLNNFPQVYTKPIKEKRPFLGIRLKDSNKSLEINEVEPGSAAEKAGIQKGDVLVQIEGKDINNYTEFVTAIQTRKIGDKIKIVVLRDGKKKKLNATLGEKVMEVQHQFGDNDDNFINENGELPMFNFRFGPDSITILGPADESVKIGQPFAWDNDQMVVKETPYLGVTPYSGNVDASNSGVKINVEPETPAERMGLLSGDVIVQFNGITTDNFNQLAEAVGTTKPNDEVRISIIRDGKQRELTGTIGKRSCSHFDDFRIFHDFKGMDDTGNYFYDYEFDMDIKDLELHMEGLLKSLDDEQITIERERKKLEDELGRIRSNENFTGTVRIDDVSADERNLLNKSVSPQLAAENNLSLERISFFPNPSMGTLNLSFQTTEKGSVKVMITDSNGGTAFLEERAMADANYSNTIDFAKQANGTYYLHIAQNGKTYCKKIVKNN